MEKLFTTDKYWQKQRKWEIHTSQLDTIVKITKLETKYAEAMRADRPMERALF